MLVGLKILFIIAIMGGLIAYMGDKLGTKVGKRKMSLFGLRPKHTSIIVTIVTGLSCCGYYGWGSYDYIAKCTNSPFWDGSVASRYESLNYRGSC